MPSPDEALRKMAETLEAKTGKSLEKWIAIVKKLGDAKHGEIVKHLKEKHGLGHGYANFVTHSALQSASIHQDAGDLIESQYAGPKSALRPIYDAILAKVQKFGDDVEVSPKKAYVSLRRNKQFATVQPSTATRMDVGLNLKSAPSSARLEALKAGGMTTHRVRLESVKDVDAELLAWLKKAYESS